MRKRKSDLVDAVTRAHTNLTMFDAIVVLCESGCFVGADNYPACSRIIKICQREQQKLLGQHDRAAASIKRLEPPARRARGE